jgi:hypothetical protein
MAGVTSDNVIIDLSDGVLVEFEIASISGGSLSPRPLPGTGSKPSWKMAYSNPHYLKRRKYCRAAVKAA